jgi:hypothetical protein
MTQQSDMPLSPVEAAWMAGLWDGEGSVGISKNMPTGEYQKTHVLCPTLQLSMTCKRTIDRLLALAERAGLTGHGYTYQEKDPARHADAHHFRVSGQGQIWRVAGLLEPYSVTKRVHWLLIKEFLAGRAKARGIEPGDDARGRQAPYSDRDWAIYETLKLLNERSPDARLARKHPVNFTVWVPRDCLRANSYNPNRTATPEFALLKVSILQDGWTQPIVARYDGEIIDGFHRWTVAADPEVAALTDGLVPVVFLDVADLAKQMMATIRHNRARGEHAVLPMGKIVHDLLAAGYGAGDLGLLLGMEEEEVDRLADRAGRPETVARTTKAFSESWAPGR